jgi:hypothetical protein
VYLAGENPKSEIPNPKSQRLGMGFTLGIWALGFGLWDLGFEYASFDVP